jgi:hypothetical protein
MLTREMAYCEEAQNERTAKSDQILQLRTRLNELEADYAAAKVHSSVLCISSIGLCIMYVPHVLHILDAS